MEDFRALVRQFPAAEDGYQNEPTYATISFSNTPLIVLLKDNLDNIQAEGLAPLIFQEE